MAEVYLDHPDAAEESKIPPVARLKKGTFFGEAALLSEERTPRNAWIRANCDMEVYCLSADDLKHSLKEHPVMETMFNAEKHKRELQRKEHLERFETGGGNFRRGFKVRLRTLGTKVGPAAGRGGSRAGRQGHHRGPRPRQAPRQAHDRGGAEEDHLPDVPAGAHLLLALLHPVRVRAAPLRGDAFGYLRHAPGHASPQLLLRG